MKTSLSEKVVKFRIPIFIISILLVIPSILGYVNTRVNYDIMSYLPKDIETMKGQDILTDEFGTGAFSLVVVEDMEDKDVAKMKSNIEQIDHVNKVIWYDSFLDDSVPISILPQKVQDKFNTEDSTLMAVIFDQSTSSDETMAAIKEVKKTAGKQCLVSGMSAVVTDTKDLAEKEAPIYVCIAVLCSLGVLCLTMDSFLIPFIFLFCIGIAIILNLGTNIFMGQISYITKALAAVLQLGVTMDYSIFLWHSYLEHLETDEDKYKAMANAVSATFKSVIGSSITTVAGFIALMFMSFTLGLDIGIVMAKGVLIGVLGCITLLPSAILIFDKPLRRTQHKPLLPNFEKPSKFVNKHYIAIAILFGITLIPAIYGNNHTPVYYNLDRTLPKSLDSIVANTALQEKYNMSCVDMVLVDKNTKTNDLFNMCQEMEDVDGVKGVVSLETVVGPVIPQSSLPDDVKEIFQSDQYEMMLVMSEYKVASDDANNQVEVLNKIIKSYDSDGMLVGEAPCTRDLINITDKDFKTVSLVSVGLIFIIIMLVFKSLTLPVILVSIIEFAICMNMAFPYYMNTEVPFIASVVIGTIQLGATVDYAILMTTRYQKERIAGASRKEAVSIAHISSTQSILVSALSFFGATFGVGLYSQIDMISSLCILMARGAIISMFVVLLVLPSMLLIFDRVIIHTSLGFQLKNKAE